MYTFSDAADQTLYNTIVSGDTHWYETQVIINGVTYAQSQIMELSTELRMFADEQPTVGACLSGELNLKMLKPSATIPRMALIQPQVRATNGNQTSAWIPQGYYYIDTREETKNDDNLPIISFHAYDAMLMTEAYYPDTSHSWPYSDINVVNEIASTIGVSVDSRTTTLMDKAYSISAPVGYTMRETLSYIGAMYAGNWVMTLEGKLLLIALNGIPEETSLITDESGNIITFGLDDGEELAISIVAV